MENLKFKVCRDCGKRKSSEEFHAHRREKDGLAIYCKPCKSDQAAYYYARNSEKVKAAALAHHYEKRDEILKRKREYHARNSEQIAIKKKAFLEANRDRINEWFRDYYRRNRTERLAQATVYQRANPELRKKIRATYARNHRDKITAKEARRRAATLRAIPAWANLGAIDLIYERARENTLKYGERYEVDHIVPLISKHVCGLHCEANLRVIPGILNNLKGNRSWPDMP